MNEQNFPPGGPPNGPAEITLWEKFRKKYPNLENFIGENLMTWIGIAVLVLGIGFFVKYSIDHSWLSPNARISIGLLSGVALMGIAHWLRNSYRAFSSILVGGGMSIMYFTLGMAYKDYGLLDQTTTFICMIVISVISVLLTLAYDRKELAILSILGAFITPLIVSNGSGNYISLFSYIIILDLAMLSIAWFKKWDIVTILTFGLSTLWYGGWILGKSVFAGTVDLTPNVNLLFFGAVIFVIFFIMIVVNNIKNQRKFKVWEFSLLLMNNAIFFSCGMYLLKGNFADFQGLFTAAMGVFNMIFAISLFRDKRTDKNLLYLLIGLVLTFISLVAPIQLEGFSITLFWAAEAVLMLWLGQRSGLRLIKNSSMFVLLLMLVSLSMDWVQIYVIHSRGVLDPILNKGFITSLFAFGSLLAYFRLLKSELVDMSDKNISLLDFGRILIQMMPVFVYFMVFLEVYYYTDMNIGLSELRIEIYLLFNFLYIAAASIYAKVQNRVNLQDVIAAMSPFIGLLYLMVAIPSISYLRTSYLLGDLSSILPFAIQLLFIPALYVIFRNSAKHFETSRFMKQKPQALYQWFCHFMILLVASTQLDHILMLSFFDGENMSWLLSQSHTIGYPIIWGIYAFYLVFRGVRFNNKSLRIVGLSLFVLILAKLFLFDLNGLSEAGRIAAFIILGGLLLSSSFLYQKLRTLITAEQDQNQVS